MKFNGEYKEQGLMTTAEMATAMSAMRDRIGEIDELLELPIYDMLSRDLKQRFKAIDDCIGDAYNLLDVSALLLSYLPEEDGKNE